MIGSPSRRHSLITTLPSAELYIIALRLISWLPGSSK